MNYDERQGAPVTMQMNKNVTKIRELVRSNRGLTRRLVANELDISKETVTKISVQDLVLRKLTTKFVTPNLKEE